jgi:hypothetical protein
LRGARRREDQQGRRHPRAGRSSCCSPMRAGRRPRPRSRRCA